MEKVTADIKKYRREWAKKWRLAHPEEDKAIQKKYYIKHREKRIASMKKKYSENKEKFLLQQKVHNEKIRNEVIYHYSNGKMCCNCCGEKEILFLAIDHINGGGNQHRKNVGTRIDRWLKLNNFPEGYQILCHNCNFAKGKDGSCPHQIKK